MRISVKVKPNSRENSVKDLGNGEYEVRVTQSPEKGKANEMVIKLLAAHFKTLKSHVNLISGHLSRKKLIEINSKNS